MVSSTSLLTNCTVGDSHKLNFKALNSSCMDTCQSKISSTPAKKVKAPKKVKAKAEVKKMTAKDNYLNVGSKSPTKKPVKDDKKLVPTKGFKWTADNIFLFVAVLVIVFLLLAGLFLRKKSIVQQMGGAIIDLLELE